MTEPQDGTPDLPEPSGSGRVRVVGTAHVSHESVDEVESTIEEERPDVVAVELDEGRYRQLKGEEPDDLDADDLLHGNTVFQFLAYWILSYVQTRMGKKFDISPGAEMLAAVEKAESLGLGVSLVDRDIQTTIQRFWTRLSAREKLVMLGGLMAGMGPPIQVGMWVGIAVGAFVTLPAEILMGPLLLPTGPWLDATLPLVGGLGGIAITLADAAVIVLGIALLIGVPLAFLFTRFEGEEAEEFDPADLTDADVVTAVMEEFRRFSPGGAEALIDERDAFIAHRLVALREAGYDVVAVVGAGHREGIERYLENPETLPPMESLVGQQSSSRFSLYKIVGYLITLGFLAFFVLLALAGVENALLLRLFAAWFLVNGIIAGALALLAGAHFTSALVGGGVAWMTSVNPLLAPGWFAGYVELRYLQVNVSDIGRLNEILDDETAPLGDIFARLREVDLFRLILIVALTNLGSMIASMLFLTTVLPIFASDFTCQTTTFFGPMDGMGCALIEGARNGADILWSLLP